VIYAANVAEDDLADDGASNEMVAKVREFAASENSEVFVICAILMVHALVSSSPAVKKLIRPKI